MIKFKQSQALTSHFESFWSTVHCDLSGNWMGVGEKFTIVDTPGFGHVVETQKLIDNVAEFLKDEIKSANAFLLFFDAHFVHMKSGLFQMLDEMSLMFGDQFWNHAILVFTKWGFDRTSIRGRKEM